MNPKRSAVRATANFERNLDDIRAFLSDAGAAGEFKRLVAHLLEEIIPALERFPALGTDFLAKAPLSVKGLALFEQIAKLAGAERSIRQLVDGEYVLLYAVEARGLALLSIRHHRQLSFDFGSHWP